MQRIGIVMLLGASLCFAQDSSDFKPASSNNGRTNLVGAMEQA